MNERQTAFYSSFIIHHFPTSGILLAKINEGKEALA
jgi:hypothetical protein